MMGSAAAALTGLMFVVITLVSGREGPNSRDGISTFSTPTVTHFAAALLVSAVLSAPWHSLKYAAGSVGLIGLCGIAYVLRIAYRAKRITAYTADVEDWVWYTVAPFAAYGVIATGAVALTFMPVKALFAIGLGVVLLVLTGIRNAWDVVTFLAIRGDRLP